MTMPTAKAVYAKSDRRSGISGYAFLLALATFAIGTDAFIIAGILPQISKTLGISISSAGLVVSVFSISYAIGAPLLSVLSAEWSRTRVLVGGLAAFTFANMLSAMSPNLSVLLITRVFAACTAGLVAPTCYAIASGLGDDHGRGKNLAVVAAGFTSATVLGVPLGVFIGRYLEWRGSVGFVALLGFVAGAALLIVGVPETAERAATSIADQLRAIRNTQTLSVLAPFLVWSASNFGLYTYIAAILGLNLSPDIVPALLLVFGVGGVFGNFVGGFASDRFGAGWPTVAFLIVLTLVLGSVQAASHGVITAALVMFVWATSMAALFTLQQQRAIAASPSQSNLMLALNNSALYFGASVGAAFIGAIIFGVSLASAPLFSAGIAVMALALLLILPVPGRGR
jgi:MFS transporter, DHA1 family, inner membrane transport protein